MEIRVLRYFLEVPASDTYGVVMRKDSPLAKKEAVQMEDLLDLPLICSRQGLTEDYPKLFREKIDTLNVVATFNLCYNAGVLVREGLGYALTFDKIIHTGSDSDLCFRPLVPALETKMYIIWKKYQVFTSISEVFLKQLKQAVSL